MLGDAMEVGALVEACRGKAAVGICRGCVQRGVSRGVYAGGDIRGGASEAVYQRKGGRNWRRVGLHLKSNNPTQSGGEKHMNGNPKPTSNCPHHSRTCYGSRGRKSPVMGMRQWGYMHARAMEVEAVRVLSWE